MPEEKPLGRLVEFDPRSLNFPIRVLLDTEKPRRSYTWAVPVHLNQGTEGACVGFAWAHEAAARPAVVYNLDDSDGFEIYDRAQELDQWPGTDYEGTSVLAGAKAAQERGWIEEYRWALGPGAVAAENDLALAVGYKGPAILGCNWYTGMDQLDENGFVRVTGEVRGGHALLVYGYSVTKNAYKIWNSWGPEWGKKGMAWLHVAGMTRLLSENGEASIPIKRRRGW